MKKYYYDPQQYVWSTWSESDLRKWLIEHEIIKSDAQIKKDKMQRLVAYVEVESTSGMVLTLFMKVTYFYEADLGEDSPCRHR